LNFGEIDKGTFDLTVKNPNNEEIIEFRDPIKIIMEIKDLDEENSELIEKIRKLL
jgi:type I restriction enzyme M protein